MGNLMEKNTGTFFGHSFCTNGTKKTSGCDTESNIT